MLKGNFNMKAFIKARVAQSVEHQVGNLEVVVSSPTLCKHFFLFLFCFRRTPGRSTCSIQMKSCMTFIRGKRYIQS